MRFHAGRRGFYCGIDLHARWMYVCILSHEGKIVYHQHLRASPEPFLKAVAPYRHDLVVGVECIFTWYWLADLCRLGHRIGRSVYFYAETQQALRDGAVSRQLMRGNSRALRLTGT